MPILHRFRDINTYLPKLRCHVTLTTLTWGTVCHHLKTNTSRVNPWRFYLQPFQRNLRGVKFLNGSRDPGHAIFRDGRSSEGWRLIQPTMTQNLTTVALAVPQIFQGVRNFKIGHLTLTSPTYWTVGHLKVSTSRVQTVHIIWSL